MEVHSAEYWIEIGLAAAAVVGVLGVAIVGIRRAKRSSAKTVPWSLKTMLVSSSVALAVLLYIVLGNLAMADTRRAVMRNRNAWVPQLKSVDASERAEAARQLGLAGFPAVEPLRAALGDHDEHVRACAAFALGKLGRKAETTIPDLFLRLHDDSGKVRTWSRRALKDLGAPATAFLKTQLHEGDTDQQVAAITALAGLDQPDWDLIRGYATHHTPRIRMAAMRYIGGLGPDGDPVKGAVQLGLADADDGVRWMAAWAARRVMDEQTLDSKIFLDAAAESATVSRRMASSPDDVLRYMAIESLAALPELTRSDIAAVVSALSDPATRNAALGADWPALGTPAAKPLTDLLGKDDETTRAASGALYLARWKAMPALQAALDNTRLPEKQRDAAWAVMQRISEHDDPADRGK